MAYMIRRIARTHPSNVWQVAGLLSKICKAYEDNGRDKAQIYFRELETASCGDTVAEALSNLWEAVEVYLNALEETGEIHNVLRERNIRIEYANEHPWDEPRISAPLGEIVSAHRTNVPASATA